MVFRTGVPFTHKNQGPVQIRTPSNAQWPWGWLSFKQNRAGSTGQLGTNPTHFFGLIGYPVLVQLVAAKGALQVEVLQAQKQLTLLLVNEGGGLPAIFAGNVLFSENARPIPFWYTCSSYYSICKQPKHTHKNQKNANNNEEGIKTATPAPISWLYFRIMWTMTYTGAKPRKVARNKLTLEQKPPVETCLDLGPWSFAFCGLFLKHFVPLRREPRVSSCLSLWPGGFMFTHLCLNNLLLVSI